MNLAPRSISRPGTTRLRGSSTYPNLKDFIVGTIAEIETRPDCTFCSFIYQAWQSGFPASYLASLSTETKAKSGLRLSPRLKEKWHDLLELVTDCPTPIGIFLTTQWTLEEVNRKSNLEDYEQVLIYPVCKERSQAPGSAVEREFCLSPRVKDHPDEQLGLANFDLINFWTDHCDAYHPFCHKDTAQANVSVVGGPSQGDEHLRRNVTVTLIDVHSRTLKTAGADDR